jgi:hypothetical protein
MSYAIKSLAYKEAADNLCSNKDYCLTPHGYYYSVLLESKRVIQKVGLTESPIIDEGKLIDKEANATNTGGSTHLAIKSLITKALQHQSASKNEIHRWNVTFAELKRTRIRADYDPIIITNEVSMACRNNCEKLLATLTLYYP